MRRRKSKASWNEKSSYLKFQCHLYFDKLWETPIERKRMYKWISRKMHIKPFHFAELNYSQLLYARRILREEVQRRQNWK